MFCALLEFALVNYASRSDMQRDRARERMERARRQWELEHADQVILAAEVQYKYITITKLMYFFQNNLPPGSGPTPQTTMTAGGAAGGTGTTNTLSGSAAGNNANGGKMNHVGAAAPSMLQQQQQQQQQHQGVETSVMDGAIPGYALVRKDAFCVAFQAIRICSKGHDVALLP